MKVAKTVASVSGPGGTRPVTARRRLGTLNNPIPGIFQYGVRNAPFPSAFIVMRSGARKWRYLRAARRQPEYSKVPSDRCTRVRWGMPRNLRSVTVSMPKANYPERLDVTLHSGWIIVSRRVPPMIPCDFSGSGEVAAACATLPVRTRTGLPLGLIDPRLRRVA